MCLHRPASMFTVHTIGLAFAGHDHRDRARPLSYAQSPNEWMSINMALFVVKVQDANLRSAVMVGKEIYRLDTLSAEIDLSPTGPAWGLLYHSDARPLSRISIQTGRRSPASKATRSRTPPRRPPVHRTSCPSHCISLPEVDGTKLLDA